MTADTFDGEAREADVTTSDRISEADAMASAYAAEKEGLLKGIRQDGYIGSFSIEEPVQVIHTKYKKAAVIPAVVFLFLFLFTVIFSRQNIFMTQISILAVVVIVTMYASSCRRPHTVFYQVDFMLYEAYIEIIRQAEKKRQCYRIIKNGNLRCIACYKETERKVTFYGDIMDLTSTDLTLTGPASADMSAKNRSLSFRVILQDMEQFKNLRGYIPFAEVYEKTEESVSTDKAEDTES